MNIEKVKSEIKGLINKSVLIKVNVGRNKYEHYEGEVKKMYPYLFTVEINGLVKSFSYADILTKDVQIKLSNT